VSDAAKIVESVLAQLRLEPVILVGHSMGAAVAVLVAASAPASVRRAVLLALPLPRDGLPDVSRAVLPHVAACLWPRAGLHAMRRRLSRGTLEEHVWDGLRKTCASVTDLQATVDGLVAELEAAYESGEDPLRSFVQAARSIGLLVTAGRTYREALGRVSSPVDVVQGTLDRIIEPSGLVQLRIRQPQWRIELLPGVGHSPHIEAPAAVAGVLVDQRRFTA